jgi:hypothetical protein
VKRLKLALKADGLNIARSSLELLVGMTPEIKFEGFSVTESEATGLQIRDRKRGVIVERITYLLERGRRESAEWPNVWCFQLLNGTNVDRQSAKKRLEGFGFDPSVIDVFYPIAGSGVPVQGPWSGGRAP